MKRQSILATLTIIIGTVAVISWLYLAQPSPTKRKAVEPKPVAVDVMAAELVSHRATVAVDVAVMPSREITLVAAVGGKIVSVADSFIEGGQFAKGDVLVTLEPQDYQSQLAQTRASLADAQQLLATEQGLARQAKREWRELGDAQANALFLRKPQLAAAKARVDATKASVNLAALNLERTRVRAPFDGRIRQLQANIGRHLTSGNPIATIFDSQQFQVKLPLTGAQLKQLGLSPLSIFTGPSAKTSTSANATMTVQLSAQFAGKTQHWPARLSHTEATVDTATQLYTMIAVIENPLAGDTPLPLGLFVKATLQGKRLDGLVKLPLKSVIQSRQIFALDDDNQIKSIAITVIDQDDNNIWVKGNINAGDRLIVSEPSQLAVGQKVSSSL